MKNFPDNPIFHGKHGNFGKFSTEKLGKSYKRKALLAKEKLHSQVKRKGRKRVKGILLQGKENESKNTKQDSPPRLRSAAWFG